MASLVQRRAAGVSSRNSTLSVPILEKLLKDSRDPPPHHRPFNGTRIVVKRSWFDAWFERRKISTPQEQAASRAADIARSLRRQGGID